MITLLIISTPGAQRASYKQVTTQTKSCVSVCVCVCLVCLCGVAEMFETRCAVLAAVAGSCECQIHV